MYHLLHNGVERTVNNAMNKHHELQRGISILYNKAAETQ